MSIFDRKKKRPQLQDLEGADRGPKRGVPEVGICKGQIGDPRGGCPWSSGFGRGGSGVPDGGAPGGQDLEGADRWSQRGGAPLEVRIWKGYFLTFYYFFR